MSILNEFKKFILRGNVIDLAVGIIVGAAFTAIVNSLVTDIIMPPIGMVAGNVDFKDFFLNLSGGGYRTLEDAQKAGAVTVNYGLFINQIIKFLIVSAAVFFLVRQLNRLHIAEKLKVDSAPPPRQEVLLEEIRDLLKKQVS